MFNFKVVFLFLTVFAMNVSAGNGKLDNYGYENAWKKSDLPGLSKEQTEKLKSTLMDGFKQAAQSQESITVQGQTFKIKDAFAYLKNMGFNLQEKEDEIYFFITWGMPEKLIKQVLEDAVSVGGEVVVKGLPKGTQDLGDYINNVVKKYLRDDGLNPNINIHPRLFDAYKVEVVPTVVYTRDKNQMCKDESFVIKKYMGKDLKISECSKNPDNNYIKIGGAVTLKYALERFLDEGWSVQKYLDLQKEYVITGGDNIREFARQQAEQTGEYKNGVVTPYDFEVGFFKDR